MAAMGKIPVIYSALASFRIMRAFEQIRSVVALQGQCQAQALPAFSTAFQGPQHTALEDISLMRGIPGMTVMEAACNEDLQGIMQYIFSIPSCAYFRIHGELPERLPYLPGSGDVKNPQLLRRGRTDLLIACGEHGVGCPGRSRPISLQKVWIGWPWERNACLIPAHAEGVDFALEKHGQCATLEAFHYRWTGQHYRRDDRRHGNRRPAPATRRRGQVSRPLCRIQGNHGLCGIGRAKPDGQVARSFFVKKETAKR